jgi:hypothetical protein
VTLGSTRYRGPPTHERTLGYSRPLQRARQPATLLDVPVAVAQELRAGDQDKHQAGGARPADAGVAQLKPWPAGAAATEPPPEESVSVTNR